MAKSKMAYKIVNWQSHHEPVSRNGKPLERPLDFWLTKFHSGEGREILREHYGVDGEDMAVGFFDRLCQRSARLPRKLRGWILDIHHSCTTLAQLSHDYRMTEAQAQQRIDMLTRCKWLRLLNFADPRNHKGEPSVNPSVPCKGKGKGKEQQQHIPSPEETPALKISDAAAADSKGGEEGAEISDAERELGLVGVDPQIIPDLTRDFASCRILEVIRMVRARKPEPTNPAGMVVTALRENWDVESPDSTFEQEQRAAEDQRQRKRRERRHEEAKLLEQRQIVRDTLAALPADEFEALKSAALESMPKVARASISKDDDPLESGTWRSFMWAEFQKRRTAQDGTERSSACRT